MTTMSRSVIETPAPMSAEPPEAPIRVADNGDGMAPLSPGQWPGRQAEEGLYGSPGWSVRLGLWRILDQWPGPARSPGPAPEGRAGAPLIDASGGPVSDYVPFHGMDGEAARQLLELLPQANLADRQNLAPSLRTLLEACAGSEGQLRLSGYGIGPQRHDERLSVEALWAADHDLQDLDVHPEHRDGCQCEALWARVSQRYGLDALAMPDEIRRLRPEWAGGAPGWWMWWD
ncbi:hypothetical protein ACSL103130_05955 [Actinomyces slackii]|uniref:Uncharacterized protein n=1 Tax=Actinomyces slackii TaxID=52774 RepID=A0A448KDM5_9ACTO|nr:hypothetical protein [Actinomyces slackii]VEG75036.1 Uncharacterised protein [Actinomyces slackii]